MAVSTVAKPTSIVLRVKIHFLNSIFELAADISTRFASPESVSTYLFARVKAIFSNFKYLQPDKSILLFTTTEGFITTGVAEADTNVIVFVAEAPGTFFGKFKVSV